MDYTIFKQNIEELKEHIEDLKSNNITNVDIILKLLKFNHREIPDELKRYIITCPILVEHSIKYIKNLIDKYTNQDSYLYDNIIEKLNNKEMTISKNLDKIYKCFLEFMININASIAKSIYDSTYQPRIIIDVSNEPDDDNEEIEPLIFRENQQEAIQILEEKGLETCIHCQATGCGKTNIILYYIGYTFRKFNNNTKIILFTERVNILKDLFDFSKKDNQDNKKHLKKIKKWKEQGIVDLEPFEIINRVTVKKNDWMKLLINSKKPTLLVINRAYLTNQSKTYSSMKGMISLILHDECHNTSSEKCNEFLVECKKFKIPIVGFSATPLRTGKDDKPKLIEIYGNNEGKLNLATNYNMIYAIERDLILPPEFYWYHIDFNSLNKLRLHEEQLQYEFGAVNKILETVIPRMVNKKFIAWCGKISLSKAWKSIFEGRYLQNPCMHNFKFYLDTSENKDDSSYQEFKKEEGNCIMFCANKHREGSDINYLDGCLFLDGVVNRGCIPFIQSIGRVLRKQEFCQSCKKNENKPCERIKNCKENEKKQGIIIDGIYKRENYERDFIEKIIGYYVSLQNICEIDDDDGVAKSDSEKYVELKNIIEFDKDNEMIHFNFNNHQISINVNKLQWKDIISKFDNILQHKIKLSENDKLLADFNILKKKVQKASIKSSTEYYNKCDELDISKNPIEEFKNYWKGWYQFLNIDISSYPKTTKELKQKIIDLNIITEKKYFDKAIEYNLPLMPEELYLNYQNFKHLLLTS